MYIEFDKQLNKWVLWYNHEIYGIASTLNEVLDVAFLNIEDKISKRSDKGVLSIQ